MCCTLSLRKVCSSDHPFLARFKTAVVHASLPANTLAIYGTAQQKELTELVPGILNQLGPDSLASLRKLAESYQAIQPGGANGNVSHLSSLPF